MARNQQDDNRDPFDPQTDIDKDATEAQRAKSQEDQDRIFLERRMSAYKRMFGALNTEDRAIIEADLKEFCGVGIQFHRDERVHCLISGRQEVWYRMREHIDMTLDQLDYHRKQLARRNTQWTIPVSR